jgi:protein arginine N-methyltransferase 1
VVQVARDLVAANGWASRVEFIDELSTNITLPELADVVVMDVRGVLPDDQVPVAIDARKRLLRAGGRMIPMVDEMWAAPVSAPDLYARFVGTTDTDAAGVDVSALRRAAAKRWHKCRSSLGLAWAPPQRVAEIDYGRIESAGIRSRVTWTVPQSLTAHGFLIWFESLLREGIALSNHPDAPHAIYAQGYFPWPEPVSLVEGQTVHLDWTGAPASEGYTWSWVTTIESASKGSGSDLRFDQLRRYPPLVPPAGERVLTSAAALDLEVLDLIAEGGRSASEVAREIAQRHPSEFPRPGDALTWVGRLLRTYAAETRA